LRGPRACDRHSHTHPHAHRGRVGLLRAAPARWATPCDAWRSPTPATSRARCRAWSRRRRASRRPLAARRKELERVCAPATTPTHHTLLPAPRRAAARSAGARWQRSHAPPRPRARRPPPPRGAAPRWATVRSSSGCRTSYTRSSVGGKEWAWWWVGAAAGGDAGGPPPSSSPLSPLSRLRRGCRCLLCHRPGAQGGQPGLAGGLAGGAGAAQGGGDSRVCARPPRARPARARRPRRRPVR